ncbi:MAG: hypothetical protein A2695_00070 [Candidatus Levybacteria bacterium RIFCSPHIGHO2_01_FULL_40_83]|nr:MAG: hypothetical protein A2695_00070 [Candidatus Levybacteria bacterium RIFCSPHIGHO2_01_FULL_40_83]
MLKKLVVISMCIILLGISFSSYASSSNFKVATVYRSEGSALIPLEIKQEEIPPIERTIILLEDIYFENELHQGMTLKALKTAVVALFNPNTPYSMYKDFSIKGVPDVFYQKDEAIEQFTLLRSIHGLKPRNGSIR